MSCEYTSTLYCHLMSFSAQKMTLYPRIILALFDVAALNCEPSSGLLIAVHFITANSNREIQFIARVESLISHLEVLSPISNRKGTFLKWHSHWGWVRSRSLSLVSPLPSPRSDLSHLRDDDYKYNRLVSRPRLYYKSSPGQVHIIRISDPASRSGFLHEWREHWGSWGQSEKRHGLRKQREPWIQFSLKSIYTFEPF